MEQAEQDRSEAPTPFKLERARRKGNVARGMDLGFLAVLSALLLYLWIAGRGLGAGLAGATREGLVAAPQIIGGAPELGALAGRMFGVVAVPLGILLLSVFLLVLLFELLQTGIVFTAHPLKPDFSRLNPAKGLKRVFSKRMLVETAKNLLKFCVYAAITWLVARAAAARMATVGHAEGLAQAMFASALSLIGWFALAALAFALFDQLIVRRQFLKQMRMSKRELRREMKDREGEPRMKQRRRQLHGEFAKASESLRNVPGADVIVTNPTHYAVALRYAADEMAAPAVVARGMNALALRIRRIAFLRGVAIVEDRTLARRLYRACPIGAQVPEDCYAGVAAIYTRLGQRSQGS